MSSLRGLTPPVASIHSTSSQTLAVASCPGLLYYYSPLCSHYPRPCCSSNMLVKLLPHTFGVAVPLRLQCACPRCSGGWTPSLSRSPLMLYPFSWPYLAQPPSAPALLILLPCWISSHRLQQHLTSYLLLSAAPHQNISPWRTEPLSGVPTAASNNNRYFPVGELPGPQTPSATALCFEHCTAALP